jgi:hypothetical protein
MQNLTASIPHNLGRIEAKRRIQEQLHLLKGQSDSKLVNIKETWTGDRMDFTIRAMGQTITGHMIVEESAVNLDLVLPWLLKMLAGSIKHQLERDVHKLLAAPRAKSSNA